VWSLLIVVAGVLIVLIGAGAFLAYRIATTHNDVENVTPASYLLTSYENVNFTDPRGGEHQGWFLLGLRGAPVIILSHGYDSNRSDLLSLGTVLQSNHFDVYLFNFAGSRSQDYLSNLGIREAAILREAIARVTKLPGINPHRVGLYGTTLGGYATLLASEREPTVAALVAEDAYDDPAQMFDVQLNRLLGGAGAFFRLLSQTEFRFLTFRTTYVNIQPGLSTLAGKPKLFVASEDAPALKRATQELYEYAPQPKRLFVLPHTEASFVSGPERKVYEDQVVNFFLKNLPLRTD
jgi:hypothetical protein